MSKGAPVATWKNKCPAGITYDLDVPGVGTFGPVAPGETVEVPDGVDLPDTVWERADRKRAKAQEEKD